MGDVFLTQKELAERWKISPRTLEQWRWTGEGVGFVKLGGAVRYRLRDIEKYENDQSNVGNDHAKD